MLQFVLAQIKESQPNKQWQQHGANLGKIDQSEVVACDFKTVFIALNEKLKKA